MPDMTNKDRLQLVADVFEDATVKLCTGLKLKNMEDKRKALIVLVKAGEELDTIIKGGN